MEDNAGNSLQLLEKSILELEHPASDDLTFQKYHRQDRNLIVTGIPRSGTSLLSVIINGFNNTLCLNEILYDVGSLPKAFAIVRKKLINGEAVPNKFNESGGLTTDTQEGSVSLRNVIIQNINENVLIGSKVNIPYLNHLTLLLTYGYKTICLIRDPVYTIGSWCSSKASEIPEAKVTDDDMHPRWRHFNFRTKDKIERMVQIWSQYAQLLWDYRSKLKIIKYENLVSEHKREIEGLARFLEIDSPPANLNLKNGNISSKYPELEKIIEKVNLFCPIKYKFGYDDHDPKLSVSFLEPKSKRKIAFFAGDGDNFHFIEPIISRLSTSEFETRLVKSNGLSQENLFNHMQWSDISWFEWANGPILHATQLPKVCRVVCRLHRYEAYTDSPKQIDWNKVDHFILVSPVMLDVFKELQISDIEERTKVHIIPNAIDPALYKFSLKERGFNIAYISRFHPDKNPALMVQMMSELVKIDPRYRCYMVGRIQNLPLYHYIKHIIEQLNLQENIIYDGIISDINGWLDDKHYVLSTSIIESQGMAIVEGMVKGLKPVIHNFFGNPCAIFDRKYVFDTPKQAVEMILSEEYSPVEYREHIKRKYNLNDVFSKYESILNKTHKNNNHSKLEKRESPIAEAKPAVNRPHCLKDKHRNDFNQKCIEQADSLIFSICIPTYNRAEFLIETIQSAINQNLNKFEIVIVDDGSTDNTEEIVKGFNSSVIRYFKKKHEGAPIARNSCIKAARGHYILWLDSDDVLLPDTIANYTLSIADYPDVDVFYGDLVIIDSFGNFMQDLKYPDYYEQNDALLSRLLVGNSIPNPGTLIRKSVYQTFGKYRLKFKRAHDYEFWARVAKQIKFKHVGISVCKWRWHDSNMSSGSVQFDTSFDIQIKRDLLKSHSLKEFFPQLNWNEEKKSLETAYFVIGNSFSQLKGYQEAIVYYEKCLEINKCENYYCALGLTYFQLEDLEKSICAFNDALKINPKNEKASEISENLKKILNAKNQKQQINSIAVDLDTDKPRCLAKEIGPLVSVIVPTFNRAQMLIESVKSILSQTYQNFEIVVVNDGGEDVSGLVDCFQDPRVKYISHPKNKGLAAARNTGIQNASGKYIALLDDDDLFYSEHLETAVNALSNEIPVVYTDAFRATYDRRGENYHLISKNVPYSIDFDRNKLLVGNLSPVNCFVFDKSLAVQAGLFDETLSTLEDWEFWIRLSALAPFKHLAQPTAQVNWRNDGTTMTSLLGSEFRKNRERIYSKYQNEINQIPNLNSILEEFQKIWAQDWQAESQLTSIVILTCNQLHYTKKCIESILQNTRKPYELIIVDNGSTDGTAEYLESEVRDRNRVVVTKIIKNIENKGFAGGNNQGIAAASGDYVLLLNNDVVVTPGWLGRMISCAKKQPEIGIVGPRSNYVSGPQLVEKADYDTSTLNGLVEFSNIFADDHAGQAQQILRVVGFCMLIKRAVIDKIGGMDDRYGLGNFEDDDFSLRATVAGFQSWIARDCFIHHFGHRTFIGEKLDLSKSLHKNWGIFKGKWGLPAEKPYGSSYRLSEMNNTRFDPSIHYYPLDNDSAGMKKSGKDSKTADALYSTIHSSLNTKPSEEVINDLQNLIVSYPEFALAHNDLGVLYFSVGNMEKALESYERAVEIDPENVIFQKNLADYYYVEMGRVEDALRIYVKILEAHPDDVETLLITGHICVALEKFQDAEVFYSRVLEIEPGHPDARQFLEKLNSIETGNSGAKIPEELYHEIQPLLNNGDPHRAIAALEGLLEKFPDFAMAYNDLGVLYYHTGKKEKAQHHYERAVEMMPDNINFQKNLADYYCLELGSIEEALNIYVGILATHPRDIETLLATGQICVALERPVDAKEFYHRVLELEPGNEDASNYLRALDKHPTTNALLLSESANTVSVLRDKLEFNDLEPDRSVAENREATVSIIISLDGIQNCVKECIKSVVAHTPDLHEILLINRGATKGILKWGQQLVKDNDGYRMIESARQASRAESFNQAVKIASGEMIVLMHNDVVVSENWLEAFKMCINLVPNIGVVGPMSNRAEGIQQIITCDESGRVEFESAAKTFYEQNQHKRATTRKLANFCLAFPRELLDKIGYFDKQFISEEVVIEDFCKRVVSGGHQNLIAADTYVLHYDRHKIKKSASARNQAKAADRKKYKEKWNSTQNSQNKDFVTVQFLARAEELSQKGQIDPAVEVLLGAIGFQPEDPRVYLGLSEMLLAAKRFQDVKDALTEMPPANNNQEIQKAQLLAYAEEGLGNYEAALTQIEQVLLMNPGFAPALNLKGILAYRNDDPTSAEKFFKQAIDSDPGYGEPYTNLGMLSLATERPQDALKFFEKAFRLSPADLDIATNFHSYIDATADFIRAEVIAREAAALYPNNQKIRYMLIDFLVQQGKYEMAMPEIENAMIKFGSDNGIIGAALKVREKLGPITIQKLSKKTLVSVCMIIKDEEKYLARCLASVKPIVDEIIVVDTGSTDRSKDIAIAFGARVYDYEWQNDFAEARNYSISKASGGWILILDGDEVISALDHEHFSKTVQKTPRSPIAYSIITRNYNKLANIVGWMPNDGTYPDEEAGIGWLPSEKVRLFYGKDQIRFEGPVHELVDPVLKRNGIEIKKCHIAVHHYGRLDKEKLDRKDEMYFDIGLKKLSAKGDDLNALRELAIQATILEKNQEALELWQRLLALNPIPNLAAIAYVNMGTIYSRLEKFEDALDAGQKAVECDPELKEARYNHAMAELHCGNATQTIQVLEDLLKGFPDYPPARFILSAAYCCGDQKEKGLERMRELRDTPMGAHLDIPCSDLAQSLIAAGKMKYAVSVLGVAIESGIVNPKLLALFKKCVNMEEVTQKSSHIPQPFQANFQEALLDNLPQ